MKTGLPLIGLLPVTLVASLSAQSVLGTWTASGQAGAVTLVLRSSGGATVKGTLSGKGTTYQLQGQMQQDTFIGEATGAGLRSHVEAMAKGANLVLVMADYGPGGTPDTAGARQLMFTRAAGGQAPAAKPSPVAGHLAGKLTGKQDADPAVGGGGPGSIGRTPKDQQLAQLILGSRWCHFWYNQRTGSSYKETVTLGRDGILTVSSGGESHSSGYAGTVAGSHQGGKRFYWRIQDGLLHLSQDGVNWGAQAGSVKLNSANQPIITSDGKEYTRCN